MDSVAFAVTTRSRLRGVHRFPQMFVSSWRIKRQLATTPGCVRFASIVAGPREFWTITVWENRDKMLDFMRSGVHERFMWKVGKWLRSFWLMRWRPTDDEYGTWDAQPLSPSRARRSQSRPRTPEEKAALEAALEAMPVLKASAGPEGAPTYATSATARRQGKLVSGGAAVVVRLKADSLWRSRRAWRETQRIRSWLAVDASVLRYVTGVAGLYEHYALAVLRDEAACARFLDDLRLRELAEEWGDGYWAMHWRPMNEFGHWDKLRLRRETLGPSAIPVPTAAARAAEHPDDE